MFGELATAEESFNLEPTRKDLASGGSELGLEVTTAEQNHQTVDNHREPGTGEEQGLPCPPPGGPHTCTTPALLVKKRRQERRRA